MLYSCGCKFLGGEGSCRAAWGRLGWGQGGIFSVAAQRAGDGLIKTLADGLGYGTHVCTRPHDAHPSQLMARERDTGLAWERDAGWTAHGEWEGRSCVVGTGVARDHSRWAAAEGVFAVPTAEAGGPVVAD